MRLGNNFFRQSRKNPRASRLLFDYPAIFPHDDRQTQHAMLHPQLARGPAVGTECDLPVLGKFRHFQRPERVVLRGDHES